MKLRPIGCDCRPGRMMQVIRCPGCPLSDRLDRLSSPLSSTDSLKPAMRNGWHRNWNERVEQRRMMADRQPGFHPCSASPQSSGRRSGSRTLAVAIPGNLAQKGPATRPAPRTCGRPEYLDRVHFARARRAFRVWRSAAADTGKTAPSACGGSKTRDGRRIEGVRGERRVGKSIGQSVQAGAGRAGLERKTAKNAGFSGL